MYRPLPKHAAGFRERLLADPGFFVKLGIELGIGLVCKITAEAQKRGEAFKGELDFVFANVVRCWRPYKGWLHPRNQREHHCAAPVTQFRQHHSVARLISEHQLLCAAHVTRWHRPPVCVQQANEL